MVSYNNSNVVQCLRQYDMFANSLNLVKTKDERDMIAKQLTKLELKVIDLTNKIYLEEYEELVNKKVELIEEEKVRLLSLIDLINQRLSYIEKRCNNHFQLTGESINVTDVPGASMLNDLEEQVAIIDKYSKNIKLSGELQESVKSLSSKITLASEKIEINRLLNIELEKKFCDLLENAFNKLGLNNLLNDKEDIEASYFEIERTMKIAQENLEMAKTSPSNILNDCQQMLDDISEDYLESKNKYCLLQLFTMYKEEVSNYEELFTKRKQVNELFRYIREQAFINLVFDEITKQFNTIMMERQDINTFDDLSNEKERKMEALVEIEEENKSEKFQSILGRLIENERKKQEEIMNQQRILEEQEKQKRLEIERKKQEEMLKKQKIIEETRKKEIEKRTKELLEQQQKSILQPKKSNSFSFETMKNITQNDKKQSDILDVIDEESMNELDLNDNDKDITFKNKDDIEKELFDEFNSESDDIAIDKKFNYDKLDKEEDCQNDSHVINKYILSNDSMDEYIDDFNKDKNNNKEYASLFQEDDMFPNIPI